MEGHEMRDDDIHDRSRDDAALVWTVTPVKPQPRQAPPSPAAERRSWFAALIRRPEPTTFHRCLAVHMHYAAPRSSLS
jgi:hypothetical protein